MSNINKLVSVIMSTYNEDLYWIEQSIESILNQTYKNIELIIVLDNPQNDSLKKLLLKYSSLDSRISVIINEQNLGLVSSLNKALQSCKGTFIARMDADDIAFNDRIHTQKEYLESNDLDFIFSPMLYIDEEGKEFNNTSSKDITPYGIKRILSVTNISNHPTWFCKKEVYDELNGYRNIPYCEDYDFSLRALEQGFKIGKVNKELLKYRVRKSGISKSNILEQFLNTQAVLYLYKEGLLYQENRIELFLSENQKKSTEIETKKFNKSHENFVKGIYLLKEKKIMLGLIILSKGLLSSKYNWIKYARFIQYKVLEKKYSF